MKKRILAVFAALVLCLGVLTASLTAFATETPHFLAINENLLQLEDRYIPMIADGLYYVPYHALDISSTGVDLGIYPVYNPAIRALTIYNREKVIVFDLAAGTCTDREGMTYTARAVTRNGQIYIPAKFICDYFGLKYSYFPDTKFGPMIRICSASAKLPDRIFLAAAQMQMEDRLRDWRKNQAAVTPTPTPTSTPTPAEPTATPGPEVTPTPPPVVDKSDVSTYLAFRVEQDDGVTGILDQLERHQVKGVFFFPADDLARYDRTIRSVLIAGHAVGLSLSGETEDDLMAGGEEASRLLRQIAYIQVHTVLLPDGVDAQAASGLREGGWLVWQTDVDARFDGQRVIAQAEEVKSRMEEYDRAVYVLSDGSVSALALMTVLLPELEEDQYDLRLAVETQLRHGESEGE